MTDHAPDTAADALARLALRMEAMEEALENQEHTIREQEKDIVTLKLGIQSLHDKARAATEGLKAVGTTIE